MQEKTEIIQKMLEKLGEFIAPEKEVIVEDIDDWANSVKNVLSKNYSIRFIKLELYRVIDIPDELPF